MFGFGVFGREWRWGSVGDQLSQVGRWWQRRREDAAAQKAGEREREGGARALIDPLTNQPTDQPTALVPPLPSQSKPTTQWQTALTHGCADELFVHSPGEVEVEDDGVVHGDAQQRPNQGELLGVVEGV